MSEWVPFRIDGKRSAMAPCLYACRRHFHVYLSRKPKAEIAEAVQRSIGHANASQAACFDDEPAVRFSGLNHEDPIQRFASMVQRCKDLSEGKRVHEHIVANGYDADRFLGNLLVEMYGKCGSSRDARAVFDRIQHRNVYSWTIMIAAYAQNGHLLEAIHAFRQMDLEGVKPNEVTFINILTACSNPKLLALGRAFHARIVAEGIESDVILNTLVSMYGKCRNLGTARQVFREMSGSNKSSVSWNAMIAAYAQHGHNKEALQLYAEMDLQGVKPDRVSFMVILEVCASLEAVAEGRVIHSQYDSSGVQSHTVESALVKMYGKCGSLVDARSVLDRMQDKDLVSWTAMIVAYAQQGHGKEALELYRQMDLEGIKPDVVTYSSLLDACASVTALAQGRAIHRRISDCGWDSDLFVSNCIIRMYGKCGRLDYARNVFDRMRQRDVITWTTMIATYAQHGHGKEGLDLYRELDQEGIKPDEVTLVTILSACSHAGLLDEGWSYFLSMSIDHGIAARGAHYGCVIDLLGRAGRLDIAEDLLTNMPVKATAFEWTAFMGACTLHGDMDRATRVSMKLTELDPKSSSSYVMFSNMCSAADTWAEFENVRGVKEARGVQKEPGYSFIEVKNRVHEFVVGDVPPTKEKIYGELQRLSKQKPETKVMLHCEGGHGDAGRHFTS